MTGGHLRGFRVGSRSVHYRLIFVLKTAQDARHFLGGAFGVYANDRIAHLAQEAYPAQEPPPFLGGPGPEKKPARGTPKKMSQLSLLSLSVMFAS